MSDNTKTDLIVEQVTTLLHLDDQGAATLDTPQTTVGEFLQAVYVVNEGNGWFEGDRPFSAEVELLHSEISEAYQGHVAGDEDNVNEELADVLIRFLDTCKRIEDLDHEGLSDNLVEMLRLEFNGPGEQEAFEAKVGYEDGRITNATLKLSLNDWIELVAAARTYRSTWANRAFETTLLELHLGVDIAYEDYRNNVNPYDINASLTRFFITLLEAFGRRRQSHGLNIVEELRRKTLKNAKRGYRHGGKVE